MVIKGNREKLLYTMLGNANEKLQTQRALYLETKNMRYLRGIQIAKHELEDAVAKINRMKERER